MTPVIHCSVGNFILFPRTTSIPRKETQVTKCNVSRKCMRLTSSSQVFLLPQSSLRLFQIYRNSDISNHSSRIRIIAGVGADVTVEEPNPAVSGENVAETSESPPDPVETSESTPAKSKRPKPVRKSDMPPVKNEELVPGASFTGKVRSVQPFGAFVDFGAFTDGLVHVSRMSEGYVKDVGAFVSVGQEVKVKIVEANLENGRISLTMRENDDISKMQQRKESPSSGSGDRTRPARKNAARSNQRDGQKSSKFVKGQVLDGTVKNLTRSGAFVSLPDGEEGFIPVSEESEGFGNMMGNSSLQVGQEVNVRVLRISRGQVTLTMKKEEDVEGMNKKLNQGVVHMATNPFELAFRKNKDIAAFLDERDKAQKSSETISVSEASKENGDKVAEITTMSDTLGVVNGSITSEEIEEEPSSVGSISSEQVSTNEEPANSLLLDEDPIPDNLKDSGAVVDSVGEQVIGSEALISEGSQSSVSGSSVTDEAYVTNEVKEADVYTRLEGNEQVLVTKTPIIDVIPVTDEVEETDSLTGAVSEGEVSDLTAQEEETSLDTELSEDGGQIADAYAGAVKENEQVLIAETPITDEIPVTDGVEEADSLTGAVSEGEASDNLTAQQEETSFDTEMSEDGGQIIDDYSGPVYENEEVFITETPITDEIPVTDEVEETDSFTGGVSEGEVSDNLTAQEKETSFGTELSEDGRQRADVYSGPVEENELVLITETPITGEIPVTDEVEETDSLTRAVSESEVSDNLTAQQEETSFDTELSEEGGQILASGGGVPEEVASTQSDDSFVNDEMEMETSLLLENNMASADSEDLQVEAPDASNGQTATPPDEGRAVKATISPALVKQLREETGAGMMDCKKALAETGGDIGKAQEFLRKKGLASADKKASRATAEGRIGSYIHDSRIGILIEVNCETDFVSRGDIFKQLVDDLAMQVAACPQVRYLVTEDVPEETVNKEKEIEMQKEDLMAKPEQMRERIVDGRIRKRLQEFALLEQPYIKNDKMVVKDWVKQTIATIGENIKVRRFVRYNLGEGLEKKSQDFAAEVAAQAAAKSSPVAPKDQPAETKEAVDKPPAVAVSAALVKQLREETGAGMMDCKKALTETGGDLEKAQEYLRKKGLSSADKKSSRLAAEGRISSYIHDTRIGCLIEVNCETDFVGRNEKFKELVDDLAMQVVACPQVEYVSMEDIPESIKNQEKEIEMQREDLKSKPENIREKIVEGRISKRLGELALLEQPFIKDDSLMVKDLVKQTVATLGENIRVRRFVRFTLGETV